MWWFPPSLSSAFFPTHRCVTNRSETDVRRRPTSQHGLTTTTHNSHSASGRSKLRTHLAAEDYFGIVIAAQAFFNDVAHEYV